MTYAGKGEKRADCHLIPYKATFVLKEEAKGTNSIHYYHPCDTQDIL